MQIHIEQGRVVIELNELEFNAFENMFENLNDDNHTVILRGEEWPDGNLLNGNSRHKILPFHLCRTIGEACAVEQAGPLDILSLYPFWKYGFCFSENNLLDFQFTEIDPHKKANLADELGMGFCVWAMEEIFDCEAWCDTADAIDEGKVTAMGTSRPDFVCTFKDGTFGIFEAKGTTQSYGTSNSQAQTGKTQTAQIEPVSGDVSVRCCSAVSIMQETATKRTRLLLLDPPGPVGAGFTPARVEVHLSRDRILEAAAARRFREKPFGDITTLFQGPQGEMLLTRKPFLPDKRHGWLSVE